MLRIGMVSPLFESVPPRLYGGTERVVYNLCAGLRQAGVDVTLFASGDSKPPTELVAVTPEALRLKQPPVEDPNAYVLPMFAEVARRAKDFDLIHNHYDYPLLPLLHVSKTPVLTTLHGRLNYPDLAAVFSAYPDAPLVSISDAQREPVPRLNWLRTVHHGLDFSRFRFYPDAGKYLAFLGRIDFEKRPDWAIEIAQRSGVPLKIAAKIEGRRSQDYFDSFLKPHVDGKFIEFIGEISEKEKSEFLGNALGLVFPIDWPEPFGLVMIEALASGTPVLARPCGSVPEILRDGVTGFVDPKIPELARRVKDLAAIDRARCRAWVEERFSLDRMVGDYLAVYRDVVGRADAAERGGKRRFMRLASIR